MLTTVLVTLYHPSVLDWAKFDSRGVFIRHHYLVSCQSFVARICFFLEFLCTGNNNARETQFLFQRLSVILQRFNAVLFGESFLAAPDEPDM